MKHWILTKDRAAMITENLDRGLMTLKSAKTYFEAYGVKINGRTKNDFIRNLWSRIGEN